MTPTGAPPTTSRSARSTSFDNPLLDEAARARARQAAPARPLGHHAGPQLPLRPPQPDHHGSTISTMIYVTGPGPRRARRRRQRLPRGDLQRASIPNISRDEEGMTRLFKQFSFPGGIPSHVAPETPGSIHEGGELGLRARRTPSARPSTTPISSWPAWSATARPRPARSPPAGTRTSSSTRPATARCCRSSISTATRSPSPRCSRASRTRSSTRSSAGTATSRYFVEGERAGRRCTSSWRPRSTRWWPTIQAHPERGARATGSGSGRAGR